MKGPGPGPPWSFLPGIVDGCPRVVEVSRVVHLCVGVLLSYGRSCPWRTVVRRRLSHKTIKTVRGQKEIVETLPWSRRVVGVVVHIHLTPTVDGDLYLIFPL